MATDATDNEVANKRINFNKLYDKFKKKHGNINDKVNKSLIREDPDFPLLLSLEERDKENESVYHKADIFSKRTIIKVKEITHVDTSEEALVVSLNKKAFVDIPYMMQLTGKSKKTIIEDLRGLVYQVPGREDYETESEYLSGDVKTKLTVAKTHAANNKEFLINVEALENVIPEDLESHEIIYKLGSTWIPTAYYEQFIAQIYDVSVEYVHISYASLISDFSLSCERYIDRTKDTQVYGTHRMSGLNILRHTLNQTDIRIYDTIIEDGKERKKINREQTILARQKHDELKEMFNDWLFQDDVRRNDITTLYNKLFNRYKPREFEKSVLEFPGMNKNISLRDHQISSAERIVFVGNTLLGHCVGAGKTFTMIAAGMRLKQLGLVHKPVFVVPNHLIEDWATEFVRLYPQSKILAATKNDFTPENRKRLFNRIATGDWDAVIVAHSSFKKDYD